jgi:hypothetical protein
MTVPAGWTERAQYEFGGVVRHDPHLYRVVVRDGREIEQIWRPDWLTGGTRPARHRTRGPGSVVAADPASRQQRLRAVPVPAPVARRPSTTKPARAPWRHDPNDYRAQRVALHEAGHAVVARQLGWQVTSVGLDPRGGYCRCSPQAETGRTAILEQRAVILHAAGRATGWTSNDSTEVDRRMARAILRELSGDPRDYDALDAAFRARAEQLVASPRTQHLIRRVSERLLERGQINGSELDQVIDAAGREFDGRPALPLTA